MARSVKYRSGGNKSPIISKKLIIIIICAVILCAVAVFCIVFLPKIIAQNQHGKNETVRFEGYIVDQFDEGIADVAIYVNDLSQGKTDAFGRFTLSAVELNSTVKFRSENPDVIISTPIIKVTQAYSRTEGEVPSGYVVRAEIIGKIKIINLTAMVTDMNGAPLSNVRITGEDISAVTSSDGKATLPIKAETTNLTFSVDYYATETRVIDKKSIDENTVVDVKMTYTANRIESDVALNYIFCYKQDGKTGIVQNLFVSFTDIFGNLNTSNINDGSFGIAPENRNKFCYFSAISLTKNSSGMYYYLPQLYFTNRGATLYLREGYMISVYVGNDVGKLFVDDGTNIKVYGKGKDGYIRIILAPNENLNIRIYTSVNCFDVNEPFFENEVELIDENGTPITALLNNIEKAYIAKLR